MSNLKKLGALIMALAMCLALAMPAFADNTTPTTGNITITNAESKDQNAYTAYKIFEASPIGDSKDSEKPTASADGHAAYYATEAQKNFWENKGLFTFTGAGSKGYTVGLAEGANAKKIAEYFNNNLDTIMDAGVLGNPVKMTISGETATATDVPFGYYFISSTNGTVVSIDTTNYNVKIEDKNTYGETGFDPHDGDNEDGELKDVYKLNGDAVKYLPDADGDGKKETPAVSVKIGDVVTYRVSTGTTNYVVKEVDGKKSSEKVQYVYVNDTIEDGLEYIENDQYQFTVTVNGETPVEAPMIAKNGNAFTVTLAWLDKDGNALYEDGAKVNVEYSAKVKDTIHMSQGTAASDNAGNTATVKYDSTPTQDYKPDPDDPYKPNPKPDPDDPTPPDPIDPDDPGDKDKIGDGGKSEGAKTEDLSVYIYALGVQKVDADNHDKKLSGAKFNVKEGDTVLKFKQVDGVYVYDPAGTIEEVESNEKGIILLKGLSASTYTLKETVAPTGYNLMSDTHSFDAIVAGETVTTTDLSTITYYEQKDDGEYKKDGENFVKIGANETVDAKDRYAVTKTETENKGTTVQEKLFADFAVSTMVENGQGTELPSTGGIGTTIFYVVGGAMVIGAGVLLITKKRMAE